MKAFLDTSVLIPVYYEEHPHHEASFDLFRRCESDSASCASHTLAEVYATLTGMPGKNRASCDEASLFLATIRERLALITLTQAEYLQTLDTSIVRRIAGGGIYDALIACCAWKAGAEVIYTWNVKHFTRLGPEIASRVSTPREL